MKKEETKKICIGSGDTTFRRDFEKMLSKLQGIISRQKIEEFGIELNTEILQDLIAGGENTGKTVLERLNKDLLDDASLPIIRRQKEQMYNQLLHEFELLKVAVHKLVKDFPYVLPEMYFIGDDGWIHAQEEAFALCDEQGKIYIDKPEQIEVYHQAIKAIDEINKLQEMAAKYYCSALGHRAVIGFEKDTARLYPGALIECHSSGIFVRMFEGKKQ